MICDALKFPSHFCNARWIFERVLRLSLLSRRRPLPRRVRDNLLSGRARSESGNLTPAPRRSPELKRGRKVNSQSQHMLPGTNFHEGARDRQALVKIKIPPRGGDIGNQFCPCREFPLFTSARQQARGKRRSVGDVSSECVTLTEVTKWRSQE